MMIRFWQECLKRADNSGFFWESSLPVTNSRRSQRDSLIDDCKSPCPDTLDKAASEGSALEPPASFTLLTKFQLMNLVHHGSPPHNCDLLVVYHHEDLSILSTRNGVVHARLGKISWYLKSRSKSPQDRALWIWRLTTECYGSAGMSYTGYWIDVLRAFLYHI